MNACKEGYYKFKAHSFLDSSWGSDIASKKVYIILYDVRIKRNA